MQSRFPGLELSLRHMREWPLSEPARHLGRNQTRCLARHHRGEGLLECHHFVGRADGDSQPVGPGGPDAAYIHILLRQGRLNLFARVLTSSMKQLLSEGVQA